MINLHEELALARCAFLETFKCLPDCQAKALAATDPGTRAFYEDQTSSDKKSLEFWAGHITYLEGLLSQKKSACPALPVAPLEFPQSKVVPQARTGT